MHERRILDRVPIFFVMIVGLITAAIIGLYLQHQHLVAADAARIRTELLDDRRSAGGHESCRGQGHPRSQGNAGHRNDDCRPPSGTYPCVDKHRQGSKGEGHQKGKHCAAE